DGRRRRREKPAPMTFHCFCPVQVKDLVQQYGLKRWSFISKFVRTRNGKQCRERWCNHLNPAVNKGIWTQEEDILVIQAQKENGFSPA
uniref:HTH myb-type domain-containing protein n=1 Tax=Salarias fasciatus TaxID=181472 RepID=A0A672IZC9_SALFA